MRQVLAEHDYKWQDKKVKGPTSIKLKSSLSKSGNALTGTRQERFYHRTTLPSKPLQSRSQRCFPRSDRITQTRQGGSLNKNQPDSQNVLMVVRVGRCTTEGILLGDCPLAESELPLTLPLAEVRGATFKAFWQKTRRVRPLNQDSGPQLGLAVREKELITRNRGGYRKGKSGSYD